MTRFWIIAMAAAPFFLLNMAGCNNNTPQPPAQAQGSTPAPQQPVAGGPAGTYPPAVGYPQPVPVAPAPPAVAYTYDYYPDAEVYFEPSAQIYFWFDGGTWHQDRVLPPTVVVQGQPHVSVQLNTDRPWTMHARVKADHPGRVEVRH